MTDESCEASGGSKLVSGQQCSAIDQQKIDDGETQHLDAAVTKVTAPIEPLATRCRYDTRDGGGEVPTKLVAEREGKIPLTAPVKTGDRRGNRYATEERTRGFVGGRESHACDFLD
ncbi:hypothetical protein AALP_AA2G120100 [Arabis alpina]|uniref:Uncharacterized protein n=1 Tax=Arabis alpina TaxID=50452 RepID=A0A087HGW0_ARAAL|nr:hypothetical protein AALP_AA2G120100 [Arabis alpina]